MIHVLLLGFLTDAFLGEIDQIAPPDSPPHEPRSLAAAMG
jgi:hypothetical protein